MEVNWINDTYYSVGYYNKHRFIFSINLFGKKKSRVVFSNIHSIVMDTFDLFYICLSAWVGGGAHMHD